MEGIREHHGNEGLIILLPSLDGVNIGVSTRAQQTFAPFAGPFLFGKILVKPVDKHPK